jgi:hypothetical protein
MIREIDKLCPEEGTFDNDQRPRPWWTKQTRWPLNSSPSSTRDPWWGARNEA